MPFIKTFCSRIRLEGPDLHPRTAGFGPEENPEVGSGTGELHPGCSPERRLFSSPQEPDTTLPGRLALRDLFTAFSLSGGAVPPLRPPDLRLRPGREQIFF